MESSRPANQINWKLWAGLILSALFLYIAFKQVDFIKTWEIILSSDLILLLLAVLITVTQSLIRAWRWKIFLKPIKKTDFKGRFISVIIGFAANCVLPARLGEFVRANSLGQIEKISKSSALGTLVIERLFDGFTLLSMLLIGLLYADLPDDQAYILTSLRGSAILLFCAFIVIIFFIAGFRYRADFFSKILEKLLFMFSMKIKNKILVVFDNFAFGLSPVRGVGLFCKSIFWTLLLWTFTLFQIQIIEASIGVKLPFIATFIIIGILSVGVAVPSAPGFIGAYHLAAQYGFMLFGVSAEKALSAAILLHASFFLPSIIMGLFAFIMMQVSYGGIDTGESTKNASI
ncbi:MAG: lysylphosphatidylglycerol synthase transmembrane domain-containing protein [Desulfobacteraceae bacterium]|jgi:uncharacterized protein (TIRG00374 family)